ncbi:MAG: prephenate/arogenate dehydrogenase [Vulcanococcus sp.]|jgi:arogenate dehydrogenase (NADP+)
MTSLWREQPVGIVGLGLIGGSLGLDLRARGSEVRALVHREATAERARQRGLADAVSTDAHVLQGCGLIVLALPLDRLLDPGEALRAALPAEAVVTDVGSVKRPVLERWQRWHPRFVASHPMAGTAQAGVEAGVEGLFSARPWVGTPGVATDPEALAAVRELAEALGADWLECDADAHDQAVALISHMPVLVSAALLQSADQGGAAAGAAQLVRRLASSGFADTSRIGGGNPELGTLMARCNRPAVLQALAAYRQQLDALEALVQGEDWGPLHAALSRCQALRPEFL